LTVKLNRFATFAWANLAYNIGVILWGAFVRATGSGAGCGSHWPLCGGEVIPRAPELETLIEFSHRVSSGLALLLVVGLVVWAYRAYPKGHLLRRGSGLALLLMITEALFGAGLVLFELVANNTSVSRAFVMAAHLVNTFLLLAALTLTALWASGGSPLRLRGQGPAAWTLGLGLAGMLVLGASGAVTALGDTLFPASSLSEAFREDFSPAAHFLIRLRVFHPLIAVMVGVYVMLVTRFLSSQYAKPGARRLSRILTALVVIQLVAGAINVVLMAPIWMQLLHLLLADLLWITLVLFAASMLAKHESRSEAIGYVSPMRQAVKTVR
jgi:heme A synthase